MKKMLILAFSFISYILFSYTIGVVTSYSTETYNLLVDASNLINEEYSEYKDYVKFINSSSDVTCDYYVNLYLTYDSTNNLYKATYEDFDYVVSSVYSPNGYKKYSTFLEEIVYYPLEKISINKLKKRDFDNYLRLTFSPGVDEYGDFKDGKFLYITDRLGGNRNLAYIDIQNEKIKLLPVWGSSEYYPRFSPDMKMVLFQGSLHGNWSIYTMPFGVNDYSKKIKKISGSNLPSYTPVWYDNNNVLYIQDTEKGNVMIMANIYNGEKQVLDVYGDMVFTPFVYDGDIYYTSLNGANFGIYKYVDGENLKVEDSFYNEHDPVIYKNKLIFTSNRDGIYRIWMKDLDTSSVTCLTSDINYDVFYPTVSDGLLFFSVYKDGKEPDIFVKKLDF
ncbi:TolB protein [Thermosipho japonicus]|uniref:TolB protein n=1 Tax=Thermosipho japonicus TaxID=90323 RepID=A0A841GKQ9_9BACT|nr:hypothetical protein [Thermosipho japonicus]MBB6061684.1 TolB protein [Thermosipho japonicus]